MTEKYPYPLRPIFNRVLIKREVAEQKSAGGIILNINKDPKINAPSIGLVLDVGERCDPPVQELKGKKVMFSRFAGDWIKIPNVEEEYYLCLDEDILGEIYV
jgi:co-chaperonin GroES (HSP10)